MKIEILTIGGEILTGRTDDTNFRFLARRLTELGAPPLWHTTVPDVRELLTEALAAAIGRADTVIMTGGLGGTPDDITRRVLSQVLRRRLILREETLREVEELYRRRGRSAPPAAQAMALIPQGAQLIPNPVGLAPGLMLSTDAGQLIVALPGVPEEMCAQMEQFVLPLLEQRLSGVGGWEQVLRIGGVAESVLAVWIGSDHPPGMDVAYLPNRLGVDLRLVRRAGAPVARPEYDTWVSGIRRMLGARVFGTDDISLEEAIGQLLVHRGLKVSVAESVTGGGVGAALTRVSGSSRYFLGGVVAYDNGVKHDLLGVSRGVLMSHGAVSGQTAEAMALGVRRRIGAHVAVSTTGIAGPTGGTSDKPVGLLYIGVSTPQGEAHVRRLVSGRSRETATGQCVGAALWVLYCTLQRIPLEEAFPVGDRPPPAERAGEGPGHG